MRYPRGTVVELTEPINDKYSPKPAGARFKVSFVDGNLQLHGHWLPPEKGSMALIIGVDKFEIVN
ncbi:MAG: DUF4314 domain-containing protein [Ruminococcus flavefaciens]|nr:DUF4314 domain-containing protein [Ruminococcus flavefaciens]